MRLNTHPVTITRLMCQSFHYLTQQSPFSFRNPEPGSLVADFKSWFLGKMTGVWACNAKQIIVIKEARKHRHQIIIQATQCNGSCYAVTIFCGFNSVPIYMHKYALAWCMQRDRCSFSGLGLEFWNEELRATQLINVIRLTCTRGMYKTDAGIQSIYLTEFNFLVKLCEITHFNPKVIVSNFIAMHWEQMYYFEFAYEPSL